MHDELFTKATGFVKVTSADSTLAVSVIMLWSGENRQLMGKSSEKHFNE